jgi:glycosyltransferase involved in cell wall biosynthesis
VTFTPLVTVLMGVRDGGTYLDEAVGSILRQSFTNFEFLIVDDGSTDGTAEKIAAFRDPRVRLVRNETTLGLTRSLNRGLAMARGALIARQDADDVSHVNRFRAQIDFLEREPQVAVLGTQVRHVDSRGRPRNVPPWPKSTSSLGILWQLLFDGPFVHASVMFRRSIVWGALGGYNEAFVTSQDFELWSRVAAAGHPMRNLPDALVDFRTHTASVSKRYQLGGVANVRTLLKDNLMAHLGPEAVPEGWPDAWIRLSNPRLFPDTKDEFKDVARAIEAIWARFMTRHPEAADDADIRRHIASLLVRAANSGAERGRVAALVPFLRAARLDRSMALRAAPRFLGHFTVGRVRRSFARRRADGASVG